MLGFPGTAPAHAAVTSPLSLAPPRPLPKRERGTPPTQLDKTSSP